MISLQWYREWIAFCKKKKILSYHPFFFLGFILCAVFDSLEMVYHDDYFLSFYYMYYYMYWQAHPIPPELTAKLLGNRVAVSPIVTVEPRRRKFHKPITLTIPVPQAAGKGMINQYNGETPTLRLLCSITGTSLSFMHTGFLMMHQGGFGIKSLLGVLF